MDDAEKNLERAKLDASNIKMMVNDPSLKGKITSNITDPGGSVYWYIRFNTPLDPESVTKHTMNVTERNGYILNTLITYDATRNLIVLNPTDLYRQNEYYILNISKKVRSGKGKSLTKPVYILFKLMNDQISEFQILKDTAQVPKPRKKPVSVRRAEIREYMAAQAFNSENEDTPPKWTGRRPTLPFGQFAVKLQLAILGLIWLVLSFFFGNFYVILAGVCLVILGLAHICVQIVKPRIRAAILYDLGVRRFNIGRYTAAMRLFQKSFKLDSNNEMTQYALVKTEHYIKTSSSQ